uniref:Uncharacterized protein n=1 Tax=Cannabis sativa TaxID=3483 RepID=A0A803PYL6_CANSA
MSMCPAMTRISMNIADVVNFAISTSTVIMATTAGQDDTNILVDLKNMPLPPREDLPLARLIEGRTLGEQPLGTTIGTCLRYYAVRWDQELKRKFLIWMDDQEYIFRSFQEELDHRNTKASDLIRVGRPPPYTFPEYGRLDPGTFESIAHPKKAS